MDLKNKVIFLDFGIFSHRAIFASVNNKAVPVSYTCLSMMLSCLSRIGVNPYDTVIIAIDSKLGSWRKEIDCEYKANRKQHRESFDIDWDKAWVDINNLLYSLEISTPFYLIDIDKIECDDIIAEGCRFYKDKECIIVSYDHDFYDLLVYDNVKIFSPHPKSKNCPYKILDFDREKEIKKVYTLLSKKIQKETSDNLTSEILTEEDFEKRKMIVSLLELPEFVSIKINDVLSNLKPKSFDLNNFPHQSLIERFRKIYCTDKIITYDKCKEKLLKKKTLKSKNNKRRKNA